MGSSNSSNENKRYLSESEIKKYDNDDNKKLFKRYRNKDGYLKKEDLKKMSNDLIDISIIKLIFNICCTNTNKMYYNDLLYFISLLKTELIEPKLNFILYFIFTENKVISRESYLTRLNQFLYNSHILILLNNDYILKEEKIKKAKVFEFLKEQLKKNIDIFKIENSNRENTLDDISFSSEIPKNDRIINTEDKCCFCHISESISMSINYYVQNIPIFNQYDSLKKKFDEYKNVHHDDIFQISLFESMLTEIHVIPSLIKLIINYLKTISPKEILEFESLKIILTIFNLPLDHDIEEKQNLFIKKLFSIFSFPKDSIPKNTIINFINLTDNKLTSTDINNIFKKYNIQEQIDINKFTELYNYIEYLLIESFEHINYIPYIFFEL